MKKGFKKDKEYKIQFLSMPMGCIATPPKIARIIYVDCYGNEREEIIGHQSSICFHCGEKWEDHEYYKE